MASVTWTGLEELKAALRQMPAHLADEASPIVDDAAERAFASIYQGYARRSGDLRKGLKKISKIIGRYGVGVQITNRAKHAWMYENGTQTRQTRIGANRGAMPPAPTFVPASMRERATMYRQLKAMLVREGFLVSGDAP